MRAKTFFLSYAQYLAFKLVLNKYLLNQWMSNQNSEPRTYILSLALKFQKRNRKGGNTQGSRPLNEQSGQNSPIKTFHHLKETSLCVCECGFQSKYETPSKVIGGSYNTGEIFLLKYLKWRQITNCVQNVRIKFISPCWHGTLDTLL